LLRELDKEEAMEGATRKCPICGDPYKVMPYFAGDQSACPDCVYKAEKKSGLKNWQASA
jgi:hypothetical protein